MTLPAWEWADPVTPDVPATPAEPAEPNKADDQVKNLHWALAKERDNNKVMADKLKAFEDKEREAEEKKKVSQGKQDEVITDLKTQLAELTEFKTKYETLHGEITTKQTAELDTVLSTLSDDVKSKYSSLADRMELWDKIEFYKNLSSDIKGTDFKAKPADWGWDKPSDLQALQARIDTGKATPSEQTQYLNELRKLQQ